MTAQNTGCQHPQCNLASEKTYRGRNGNSLKLCEKHYYNLVSGKTSGSWSVTNPDYDAAGVPFWDSGIRCEEITQTDVPDVRIPPGPDIDWGERLKEEYK